MLDFNGFSCVSSDVVVISVECVVRLRGIFKFLALGEVELGKISSLGERQRIFFIENIAMEMMLEILGTMLWDLSV